MFINNGKTKFSSEDLGVRKPGIWYGRKLVKIQKYTVYPGNMLLPTFIGLSSFSLCFSQPHMHLERSTPCFCSCSSVLRKKQHTITFWEEIKYLLGSRIIQAHQSPFLTHFHHNYTQQKNQGRGRRGRRVKRSCTNTN